MNFGFVEPWHEFLPRTGGHLVGVMGSGGKTSLVRAFAGVCAERDQPVLLTTTTRSEVLADLPAVAWSALDAGELPAVCFVHDGIDADGKWRGLSADQADELVRRRPARLVVAEVDGAAGHPVKWHRAGEPVWPAATSLAVVCLGLGALEEPVARVMHRDELAWTGRWPELAETATWSWDHYERLLTGPGGYLDQVPSAVPALLALGQMGQLADSIGLFDFVGRAMADPRLPLALMFEAVAEPTGFRTAYRLADSDDGDDDDGARGGDDRDTGV